MGRKNSNAVRHGHVQQVSKQGRYRQKHHPTPGYDKPYALKLVRRRG